MSEAIVTPHKMRQNKKHFPLSFRDFNWTFAGVLELRLDHFSNATRLSLDISHLFIFGMRLENFRGNSRNSKKQIDTAVNTWTTSNDIKIDSNNKFLKCKPTHSTKMKVK